MSTRSTIKIECGKELIRLYHHCDGYPEGVGFELCEKLIEFKDENWYFNGEEFANKLVHENEDYEITTKVHGDEDYLYTIYNDGGIKCESLAYGGKVENRINVMEMYLKDKKEKEKL